MDWIFLLHELQTLLSSYHFVDFLLDQIMHVLEELQRQHGAEMQQTREQAPLQAASAKEVKDWRLETCLFHSMARGRSWLSRRHVQTILVKGRVRSEIARLRRCKGGSRVRSWRVP